MLLSSSSKFVITFLAKQHVAVLGHADSSALHSASFLNYHPSRYRHANQKVNMNWLFVSASVLFVSLSWTLISVVSNYNAARKIGFPIIISPVSPLNPLWILTSRAFPRILLLRHLPFGLGKWARCTYMGWTFQDKHALHDELGPVFVVVTPSGNEVTVADRQAAHTILSRRKDFIKPAVMYGRGFKLRCSPCSLLIFLQNSSTSLAEI